MNYLGRLWAFRCGALMEEVVIGVGIKDFWLCPTSSLLLLLSCDLWAPCFHASCPITDTLHGYDKIKTKTHKHSSWSGLSYGILFQQQKYNSYSLPTKIRLPLRNTCQFSGLDWFSHLNGIWLICLCFMVSLNKWINLLGEFLKELVSYNFAVGSSDS